MASPDLGIAIPEGVIKQHWQAWNELVTTKGEQDEEDLLREYSFSIDRRTDPSSLFTAEIVQILKLYRSLEQWTDCDPKYFKSNEEEEWIEMGLNPKNAVKPVLGSYPWRKGTSYVAEQLVVYLSNHGRALEMTRWNNVQTPDAHTFSSPFHSAIKRLPTPDEIQVKSKEELGPEVLTEQLQPLKGSTLARLDILLSMVKAGSVVEPKPQTEEDTSSE